MVAVATGFGVAATVFRQPGGYPLRLLASQLVIILACVLIVSRSRITRAISEVRAPHFCFDRSCTSFSAAFSCSLAGLALAISALREPSR
jgi:hypothetical protein